MKVTQEVIKPVFKPVVITLETEEEVKLLKALSRVNINVSKAVIEHGLYEQGVTQEKLQHLLGSLHYELRELIC